MSRLEEARDLLERFVEKFSSHNDEMADDGDGHFDEWQSGELKGLIQEAVEWLQEEDDK